MYKLFVKYWEEDIDYCRLGIESCNYVYIFVIEVFIIVIFSFVDW